MAYNYYICNEYIAYNLQSPWTVNSFSGLQFVLQEDATNIIGLTTGTFSGQLEVAPFTIDLNRDIASIDVLWDQWNCSPAVTSLYFTFYISIDGGNTWKTSNTVWRSAANGTKVRMLQIISGAYYGFTSIQCKFTVNFSRNGGYTPTLKDNVTLYFNSRMSSTSQAPEALKANAALLGPTVTGVIMNNSTVAAPKMNAMTGMFVIDPMTSWNGTSAVLNIPSLMKSTIKSLKPIQVSATGSLTGLVQPLPLSARGLLPIPFVKDQETVVVNLDPLVANKEIELEVTLYDI